MWSAGSIIKVSFDRGIMLQNDFEQVVSEVQRYSRIWSHYANIFFNFIDGPFEDGQIRITFESGPGHYSYVGDTGPKSSRPTMNFDSREINASTPPDRFQRVVLHEFGHALGCIHKHSQLKSPIEWDKVKLYDHYAKHFGWDKATVDLDIIKRYEVWSTDDTDSIMQYEFGSDFTTDSKSYLARSDLSLLDKHFIGRCYPIDAGSAGAFTIQKKVPGPTLCSLPRDIVRHLLTSKATRGILFGVTRVTSDKNFDLRSDFDAPPIPLPLSKPTILLHAPRDDDTYQGSWLSLMTPDPVIQFGHITVTMQDLMDPIEWNKTKVQTFAYPYPPLESPTVLVWFHSIKSLKSSIPAHQLSMPHAFKVAPSNISNTSFEITCSGLPNCTLGITWLSYPATKRNIHTGVFNFENLEGNNEAWRQPFRVDLNGVDTAKPTRVFAAFSQIAVFGRAACVSLDFPQDTITRTEMDLKILPSPDTPLRRVSVAYIVTHHNESANEFDLQQVNALLDRVSSANTSKIMCVINSSLKGYF